MSGQPRNFHFQLRSMSFSGHNRQTFVTVEELLVQSCTKGASKMNKYRYFLCAQPGAGLFCVLKSFTIFYTIPEISHDVLFIEGCCFYSSRVCRGGSNCEPDPGPGKVVQVLTHGIGFDRR